MNKWILSAAVGATSLLLAAAAPAAVITFADFSSTAGLQLNGAAAGNINNGTDPNPVLRVTPSVQSQAGSAFTSNLVGITQFSTMFEFRISNPLNTGADGLTFAIQSVGNTALGAGGGSLGYGGIGQSVAIEFDTWDNGAAIDPNGNHIGIDQNGSLASIATVNPVGALDGQQLWTAWIDYDGVTLDVSANTTGVKPGAAMLSQAINIPAILLGNAGYVGFTSGTGFATGDHDIIKWSYRSVPEPASLLLLGLGLLGLGFARPRGA